MIFLLGDTHGDVGKIFNSIVKIQRDISQKLTEDDYIIILGDFGMKSKLKKEKPSTTYKELLLNEFKPKILFIDGNHENFEYINSLETKEMFGGTVGIFEKNVFHLKRGEIYEIEGISFFCMGGALSLDRAQRILGVDYFHEEIPNYQEMDNAIGNLNKVGRKVDFVLTHTAPTIITIKVLKELNIGINSKVEDNTEPLLNEIDKILNLNFNHWFFGHFHIDTTIYEKYTCVWKKYIKIEKDYFC